MIAVRINCTLLVRLLAIVGFPCTLSYLHVGELCRERRLLWRAGIYAKTDFVGTRIHVTDAHLTECHTVSRTLDAVIIFTT